MAVTRTIRPNVISQEYRKLGVAWVWENRDNIGSSSWAFRNISYLFLQLVVGKIKKPINNFKHSDISSIRKLSWNSFSHHCVPFEHLIFFLKTPLFKIFLQLQIKHTCGEKDGISFCKCQAKVKFMKNSKRQMSCKTINRLRIPGYEKRKTEERKIRCFVVTSPFLFDLWKIFARLFCNNLCDISLSECTHSKPLEIQQVSSPWP